MGGLPNLAARLGGWSARHRLIAIASWLAVLLDATVVRAVLLPSVMALLGDRNWYLPAWIARLTARGG